MKNLKLAKKNDSDEQIKKETVSFTSTTINLKKWNKTSTKILKNIKFKNDEDVEENDSLDKYLDEVFRTKPDLILVNKKINNLTKEINDLANELTVVRNASHIADDK